MALKAIMLRHKIDRLNNDLSELRAKEEYFKTRENELAKAIEEAQTEEERNAVEDAVNAFDSERSAHDAEVAKLEQTIADLERSLSEVEDTVTPTEAPAVEQEERRNTMPNMNVAVNIRALPKNTRAFDALPMEQRAQILEQEDVKGFLAQLRSMKGSTRSISGGELTIPVVFLELIAENMYRYSKLINRVRVVSVTGQSRQTIAGTIPEAVWTEMCGNINQLSLVFNQVTLDGYKVAGFIPVCNALLEDSDIALAAYVIEAISEAIGLAKDKAILYGKGNASKMPLGIVTRLAQTVQPAGYPATAPAWIDLHTSNIIKIDSNTLSGAAFWAALTEACGQTFTRYSRGNQFWCMNSKTYNRLKSKAITFTASGDIVANVFGILPIVNGDIDILEFMPDGDIVGGYGDLYLFAQRSGMVIDASEHVQFLQDNTVYRGRERADGMPVIPGAFVAININNTDVTTEMVFAGDDANTLSGILLPAEASVPVGGTIKLGAVLVPFGVKGDVTYASAATAKATVSSTGVVTGVATGTAVITATSGAMTAKCTVTVTA